MTPEKRGKGAHSRTSFLKHEPVRPAGRLLFAQPSMANLRTRSPSVGASRGLTGCDVVF